MNIEHRIMYSVYFIKKTERSDSTLRHSTFDILRFAFNAVSYKVRSFKVSINFKQLIYKL